MVDVMKLNGFRVYRNYFSPTHLSSVQPVLRRFHQAWLADNAQSYAKGTLNSAYLTSNKYLSDADRLTLFKFIASTTLMDLVNQALGDQAAFMNTQLFFDPKNREQKNYWHRDPQYHLSLAEQEQALTGPKVIHVRIPLVAEAGIELLPATHKRWDTPEELDVRLSRHGRHAYDDLPNSEIVLLNASDVLVFDANMIHRGLYGCDRFALDILFCQPVVELSQFIEPSCLPSREQLTLLDCPTAFQHALNAQSATSLNI